MIGNAHRAEIRDGQTIDLGSTRMWVIQGVSGKPSSTIAFEKGWNPMLRLDRATFIERLADVPAEPADMQQILAFNRGEALEAVR